ncbi:MAG TPA: type I-U CRISPR-associated helicase/endonuclease Cas3 [Solirubrobacteraceae bacterium]|jgi:CRISPR-associated endonuclease/helicase Cas3|nr:type I-U CRISPR-associated helicase/endonuclease Cas3 [Solirubrobacteraceae bacterium]
MPETDTLEPQQFDDFYSDIWARKPYRWQTRAAVELAEGRLWEAVSAPTGAGKTTLIECFLFALACTPSDAERRLPLRLFWVIDRRGVADQVVRHARYVVKAINRGRAGSVAAAVRVRLADMAGDEHDDVVQVRLWRGGLTGETVGDERAPFSPCTPAIVCTTVDQIGSRMLFRGYGVSNGSRPVEAALAATDSLVVLDEAHLSAPFLETATAIGRAQRSAEEQCVCPLHLVQISATLDDPPEDTFTLTEQELSEPALARRFNASKPIELKTGRDQVRTCLVEARRLAKQGARAVAVVVNTVGAARSIHTALRNDGEALLLIGPVRPLDRQTLLEQLEKRAARQRRAELEQPLFVVGTQTIEVGLDLDFDALVTACAPLPSLAQRFGRLDRSGEMDGAGRGVIVEPPNECPIYGEATRQTWEWLCTLPAQPPLVFGPAAIDKLRRESSPPDPPDRPQAPILGPWHVERLMHTSVSPSPDLDVAIFLHGKLDEADVQICWRADLDVEHGDPDVATERAERMRARPPHPGELLSVSPGAARRWLRRQQYVDDLPDLESAVEPTPDDRTWGRWALRIRPPDGDGVMEVEEIQATELRPGDIIAVPSRYGGCDEFGWSPEARKAVTDLGNLASRRPRILLPGAIGLARHLGVPEDLRLATREIIERVDGEQLSEIEAYDELLPLLITWLGDGGGFATESSLAETAAELKAHIEKASDSAAARRRRALPIGAPVNGRRRSGDLLIVPPISAATRRSGKPVLYETHVSEVAKRAQRFTRQLGLSRELAATIDLAARNHDAGKLDPRFQAWLNDGAPLNGGSPLAKSGFDPRERRSREAQEIARWPKGKRHESLSALLLAEVEQWPQDVLPELLVHLVHTHHGDGRPFRIASEDQDPGEKVVAPIAIEPHGERRIEKTVESDSEIPWPEHVERYIALNRRYGLWGLAALETILVLADRGVSAEEGR